VSVTIVQCRDRFLLYVSTRTSDRRRPCHHKCSHRQSGKNTAQAEIYKSNTHCTIVGIPTWHSDTAFQCGLLIAACSIHGGCKAVVSKAVLSVRLHEHVEQDVIFASLRCMRITTQLAGAATFPVASIAE